ncbi:unnamed protein product [Penicillium pancosmium]
MAQFIVATAKRGTAPTFRSFAASWLCLPTLGWYPADVSDEFFVLSAVVSPLPRPRREAFSPSTKCQAVQLLPCVTPRPSALNLGPKIVPRVRRDTLQAPCSDESHHARRGAFSDLADGWVHFDGLSYNLNHIITLTASFVIIGLALIFSRESFLRHFRVTLVDALLRSFEGMLDDAAYSQVDSLLEDFLFG